MANIQTPENPLFNTEVRAFETGDYAHADLFNDAVAALLENDIYLKKVLAKSGNCNTAQGTAAKAVDCPDFELRDGARVMVTFQYGNSSNYMTLNVNNTGAYFAWFPIGTNRTYNDKLISKFIIPGCAYEFIFQEGENAKDSKWVYCGINYQTMTGVKGNAETDYRTGDVNLTAENIGAVPLTGGTMSGSLVVNAAARLNGITNAYTNVPDNSGFPKYLKMVDITDWYNSTGTGVAKRGFVGTIYTQRSGGSLNSCDRICQLIVSAAYKKTTVEDGTCLTLRTSGDFEPCILCDETALKYYLAIKVKRSSCQMYIQGVFVGDFVNSWVNTTDSTGTMPDGYSIVCNDYKPITTKSHYEWIAQVTCAKWSRLCHVAPRTGWGLTGSKYIISIAATRANVLYHDTFLVTYHHEKKGSIIKLSGSGYSSGYKVRVVSRKDGNYGYFELYDDIEGASGTIQNIRCALLPLESDVVTTYPTFTSGVTIPENCVVAQELTVEDTEMQGTISNSVKAEYATTAESATKATQDGNGNVISDTYLPLRGGYINGNLALNGSIGDVFGDITKVCGHIGMKPDDEYDNGHPEINADGTTDGHKFNDGCSLYIYPSSIDHGSIGYYAIGNSNLREHMFCSYNGITGSRTGHASIQDGIIDAVRLNSTGGDYAEYWEWSDGNPDAEDRVGLFVTFTGTNIRIAESGDNLMKVGVVSSAPSIIGDSDQKEWKSKYLKDIYGREIWEEVTLEDGTLEKERVLNPDYDETQKYIRRADRPEWDAVGTHGKLVVRDDGTCQPDGFCVPTDGGIATAADDGFYVMERLDESHIRIYMR